ncbi:MAG: Ig-like domain-containing protein [Chitinispirillaceae bacterium]
MKVKELKRLALIGLVTVCILRCSDEEPFILGPALRDSEDIPQLEIEVGQTVLSDHVSTGKIVFHFKEKHEVGVFANGDYWVKGPVTLTRISPDYDGYNYGWEVNPVVEGGHGFQDGGYGGGFDTSLIPDLEYFADPSDGILSIVKTTPNIKDDGSFENRPCIASAEVLTVVAQTPPGNGSEVFRPPYVGKDKPYYYIDSLRTDLLPQYSPVDHMPTLQSVQERFSKLQMDHKRGGIGRSLRPSEHMNDYQPANTPDQNNAVLRLMMNDPVEDKMPALISFVQFGIDKLHTAYIGQTWPDGGGHQPGHRLPLAFTAVMLDLENARAFLREAEFFHGNKLFFRGENDVVLWGTDRYTDEEGYWGYLMRRSGNRSQKDPYGLIDGGKVSEGAYQVITSQAHKGEILATHLMPVLKEAWNIDEWEKMRNYTDRWVMHGQWAMPDSVAPYDGNEDNYGVTFGPDQSTGEPISGNGRFPEQHGAHRDGGQYKSSFVAAMWDEYRHSVGGAEQTAPFAVIVNPLDGSTVGGYVDLGVTAFGVNGIESVQFLIDGNPVGSPVSESDDNSPSMFRLSWDSSLLEDGSYVCKAVATDTKDNVYVSSDIMVTVRN